MTGGIGNPSTSKKSAVLFAGGPLEPRSPANFGMDLAAALVRTGTRTLFYAGDGLLAEKAAKLPIGYRRLKSSGVPLANLIDFPSAASAAKKAGVGFVHALSHCELRAAARFAKALRAPLVISALDYPGENAPSCISDRTVRAVVASSEAVREELVNVCRVPKDIIHIIPPGMDFTAAAMKSPRKEGDPRAFAVGAIGDLVPNNGHLHLIEALKILNGRGFDARLFIVGEGPQRPQLERLALSLGMLDCVFFLETRILSAAAMNAFDVFVLPSVSEGFGSIVLDAYAYGVPAVASGVGGIYSAVRHEETGLIVPAKNPGAIANSIIRMLDDPGFASALARRGRAFAEKNFSIDKIAQEHLLLYASLLEA
jgi:glycosyltransferase involved in cell wall biosynthesis